MFELGGIRSSSDRPRRRGPAWSGSPRPRGEDDAGPAPEAGAAAPTRGTLLLGLALQRLDALQSQFLLAAARSRSSGSRPLADDVDALSRPLRIALRALQRAERADLLAASVHWLARLGIEASDGLKSGSLSLSSLPRREQVEDLLHRLATESGRGAAVDALGTGFRDLRRAITDALCELPPVLDVEA